MIELDLPMDLQSLLRALEEEMVDEALKRTGGNRARAANLLGMGRTTLVEKLRRRSKRQQRLTGAVKPVALPEKAEVPG